MSNLKLLGQKRESPILPNYENEELDIVFPEVELFDYTEEEKNSLKENELKNSCIQIYKISKKLSLGDEKFKIKKNFSTNLQLFKPIKKFYPKDKIRTENDMSKIEKEYISYCLEMKNYSIEQLKEINKLKNIKFKKYNMILDIDGTMLKAVELNDVNFPKKDTDMQIKGTIYNNLTFEYYCRYRPYLFHFISELKDYFNFYVSTLAHTNYANKIIEDFKNRTNIDIPQKNIISNESDDKNISKYAKTLEEIKSLDNNENELNNTLIIDDIVNYWIKPPNLIKTDKEVEQCIKCLIPSKRYVINAATGTDKTKFWILIHNNIFEEPFDNKKNYSFEVDYSYCIEKDSDSEKVKYGQFYYLEKFIKKCIKYSLFSGIPLVNAMDFYRKKIFEDCKFNLKYLGNEQFDYIRNIINKLGGNIVTNTELTTHFITENKINMKKIVNKNKIFININYIFQCYFNLNRMNEFEKQFEANIYS